MSCAQQRDVDRHFAGRLSPDDAHRLNAHVSACVECRRYFERHLLLAKLDPKALGAEERVARGLGLAAAPRRRTWALASAAAMAAAIALVVFVRAPDGFVARGGKPDDRADVAIYRVSGGAPKRAEGRMHAGDALAFAYRNPERWTHLLVFGVDETGRVCWYYPKWEDAAADPRAIEIQPSVAPVELGEAVVQALSGKRLTVHALFTNDAPSVHEIEARLGHKSKLTESGRDTVTTLEVEH